MPRRPEPEKINIYCDIYSPTFLNVIPTKHSRMLSQLTAHSRSAIICYNEIPHSQISPPTDSFYLNVFDKCHLHSNLIEQLK